jgi:Protein of unknown function (DUF3667)
MKLSLLKFKPKLQQIKGIECLNCKQPLEGQENFCSYCGQKNSIKQLSFTNFIGNLFSGFFSYDSRFWRTFIPLLTKPGKVSKEYIEGKRIRFVNPFQLYLNISIIFFLLLGITNRIDSNKSPVNNIISATKNLDSITQKGTQQLDSVFSEVKEQVDKSLPNDSTKTKVLTNLGSVFKLVETESKKTKEQEKEYVYNITKDTLKNIGVLDKIEDFQNYYKKYPSYNSEQAIDSLGYKKTFWNTFYYQQVINIAKKINQIESDGGKSYIKTLTSYISISLFIFLPVFTMFLKLLYIRRKFTYMEHLVFVFHTQTVFFLLFIIFYLLNFFVEMESATWVFIILFLLYLYKALRFFYQQGRVKTIVKYILLNSYYLFLAGVGFMIVSILSFLIG